MNIETSSLKKDVNSLFENVVHRIDFSRENHASTRLVFRGSL